MACITADDFCETASISLSVSVSRVGCSVTSMASDFLFRREATALEQVEHRDAGHELLVGIGSGAQRVSGRNGLVEHEGEVAAHGQQVGGGERLGAARRFSGRDRVEEDLEGGGRAGTSSAFEGLRGLAELREHDLGAEPQRRRATGGTSPAPRACCALPASKPIAASAANTSALTS